MLLRHPVLVQKMPALISLGKAKAQRLIKAVLAISRHNSAVTGFRFILTVALLMAGNNHDLVLKGEHRQRQNLQFVGTRGGVLVLSGCLPVLVLWLCPKPCRLPGFLAPRSETASKSKEESEGWKSTFEEPLIALVSSTIQRNLSQLPMWPCHIHVPLSLSPSG